MVYEDVLSLIGNTPLIKIRKLVDENCATILAKLEMFNPSGSVKDRIVKYMVEKAEREGRITSGTILEASSGNTGISLAMIGAVKGYKVVIVMPESMSVERRKIIKSFGAELILVSDEDWKNGKAIDFARELAEKNGYFFLNQYENENNVWAHYETTGKEIIEQTGGKIDVFVAGIGTGGTIVGVGKRLKEFNPNIKIVGVEVSRDSKIQGLRNISLESSYKPPILDFSVIDEIVVVRDEDALKIRERLIKEEGLFVGLSSGANMFVALEKAKELGRGKVVVTVFPDSGNRYLSVL